MTLNSGHDGACDLAPRHGSSDHLRQGFRDGSITVSGCMLITHGRSWGGVAEPGHELRECRASLGCQDGARVTQIVKVEVRPTGGRPRRVKPLPKCAGVHVSARQCWKQQGIRLGAGVVTEMIADEGDDMRGDMNFSAACRGLWGAD